MPGIANGRNDGVSPSMTLFYLPTLLAVLRHAAPQPHPARLYQHATGLLGAATSMVNSIVFGDDTR